MRRWAALVIIWGLGAVSGSMVGWTSALFTSTTTNPGSSFAAANSFCPTPTTQTASTNQDSHTREDEPGSNFGLETTLNVQSRSGRDRRAFVYFPLPPKPAGCQVSSAILRLYSTSATAGRTIEAYRANAPWTETGITWMNAPNTVGSVATTESGTAPAWKEWIVTSQVDLMYSGTGNGFLLRDGSEDAAGSGHLQIYQSEEGIPNSQDPQLIITFSNSACSSPGSQMVTSFADSLVAEAAPTANYGTDPSNFGVRSFSGGDARSLVSFALPAIPSGCSVAASNLRLFTATGVSGRTLQAFQLAASWTETVVTWNTQPATTGTAATVPSVASDWVDWTVTSIVQAMYAGTNNGFLIRDATENAATAQDQTMHPRENANDPQLVVTFG